MSAIAKFITFGLVLVMPWALLVFVLLPNPKSDQDVNAKRFWPRAMWLQLLVAAVIFGFMSGRNPGDAYAMAFFAPVVAPWFGPPALLWLWGNYYGFLAVPVLLAIACSIALSALWCRIVPAKWRAFVFSVAVVTFVAAFVVAGQLQFRRDVLAAADTLQPDCMDSRSFADVLPHVFRSSNQLHARAVKGGAAYGWSFRTRSFYKIPNHVSRYYGTIHNSRFRSPFPRC